MHRQAQRRPALPGPGHQGRHRLRRHGGSASQVRIAAQHLVLLTTRHDAYREYEEAKGSAGEFDALCKWSAADYAIKDYEAKLERLAELRAAVKQLRAGRT